MNITVEFTRTLVDITTAETVEETAQLAVLAMVACCESVAVCLLLWDAELGRYIVGETRVADSTVNPAAVRREALRSALAACTQDDLHARRISSDGNGSDDLFYQPLNTADEHVAAFVCFGSAAQPDTSAESYQLLLRVVTRALSTISKLHDADREHAELQAERARLEELLQAVERQGRTIDQLLAKERQFSAALEAKVEERTAELRLTQSRLVQQEKLAVIGQLAGSLAHELNNPLQAIRSGLDLIVDELDSGNIDYVREDLGIIQEELERIEALFRHMLDFYRPVSYDYVPLDLNAIAEGVRVLMRKRLQQDDIELTLDLTPNLPTTCGDNNQIKQVLLNLVLNAAEAIPNAGGHITLKTAACDDHVCMSVHDDGAGITRENLERLFEPLFTTKTRGLGLGLAISREIIERHHGRLEVASEVGVGTVFTIRLPIKERCNG